MHISDDEVAAMRAATEHAIAYRQSTVDRDVPPRIDPAEATLRFAGDLPDSGVPASEVIAELVDKGDAGLMQIVSSRFFGYVVGASHPAGVAADILSSGWGQVSGYAQTTPTTAAIENITCAWIIDLLGLPKTCGAGLVTGATMGNTAAVMTARNALLKRHNWDVEAQGLFDAPKIHVLIGAEAHSATAAALRYAGMGANRVHRIPTDDQGRMQVAAYRAAIQDLSGPILTILQAGHINSGAFDDFDALIPLAKAKESWVHVDGAFGLWVHAVPELAHRLAGVAEADSWAVDLHKWLNAPYDAGMVITRDRGPLVAAMSAKGAYLPQLGEVWDPNDSTPELSRRARGVPSYAILRAMGKTGVREMIARHCRLAEQVADALREIPGITVLNEVMCNQVAFYCGDDETRSDATLATLAAIHAAGRVHPSHGEWRGGEIIRVSVTSYATTDADIAELIAAITTAWQEAQR